MGADFVVTGSINQCTPEAGTSDAVKALLAEAGPQDTDFAPAGDMFEIGARVQCIRRGQLFTGRANRLYEIWRKYESLEAVPPDVMAQVENQYFRKPVSEVWAETEAYYRKAAPDILAAAARQPKQRLAMILRWYWINANRLAMVGDERHRTDWQVHCGPAMGAFNEWARGGRFEDWRARHVDDIAFALMEEAHEIIATLQRREDTT
jgi:trans-AT polyketide synthase/acyltransferase/oxidoreductase domain-containing protein